MQQWRQQINELHATLTSFENRSNFLRALDKTILARSKTAQEILEWIVSELPPLVGATHAQAFGQTRGRLELRVSRPPSQVAGASMEGTSWGMALIDNTVVVVDALGSGTHRSEARPFLETRSRLIIPYSVNRRLRGVISLEAQTEGAFAEESVRAFAELVRGQLEVALRDFLDRTLDHGVLNIHKAVFAQALDASQCLTLVVNHLKQTLLSK